MNYLVTGGAGFLGSHLCKNLLSKNNKVYCLDNLLTGFENNINELKDNPNFIFINEDITTYNLDKNLQIDGIFNLACPASPIQVLFLLSNSITLACNPLLVIILSPLFKLFKKFFSFLFLLLCGITMKNKKTNAINSKKGN